MKSLKSETIKARIGLSGPPLNRIPGPPPKIPDHEMVKCIGQGSYGEVWLARNAVGTWRAVKIVYRQSFKDPRPYEREFAGIQSYEPISRTNEGLIDVLQIGRNDAEGYFYYVMELADSVNDGLEQQSGSADAGSMPGRVSSPDTTRFDPESYIPKTLSRVIHQRGRLSYEECLTLGLTLNLALGHLHRHGLIHRDVKPSNIIFVNGVPKLTDIGLVTDLSEAESFVGTEGFIPPEGPNSSQADLYALGKVLYEASMGKDRNEFPEPLTQLGLDPDSRALMELNAVLVRACAPYPKDRYHRAEEMNADLALLHNGESVRDKHALARRVRWMTRIGVGTVAVLVLAVVPYSVAIRQARIAKAAAQREAEQHKLAKAMALRAETEARKRAAVAQFLSDTLRAAAPSVALGRDTRMMRDLLDGTAEKLNSDTNTVPEVEAELREILGQVYLEVGAYIKAESMLRRAVDLNRDVLHRDDRTVARCLSELSLAIADQGRGTKAEEYQQEALQIRNRNTNELDVAESFQSLGLILASENKLSESQRMYQRAFDIRERLLGHENVLVADAINGLASSVSSQGQWAAAEAKWQEAIRINRKLRPKNHPGYLWMLNGVAQAQLAQRKYSEAEATARQCVEQEKQILGPDHPLLASSLTRLARILNDQNRNAEAKTNLQEALVIWTKRLNNQDPTMGETVAALFDLLLSEHNFTEAKEVFDQVSVEGDKPNESLMGVCGNYLARTGQWKLAAETFRHVLQLNPENHIACQALASLYVQLEDPAAYRDFTVDLLSRFGSVTNDPRIADRMAKSCLILPGEGQALTTAAKLANVSVTFDTNSAAHPWFRFCKALAEFRVGNFEESKRWIAKVQENERDGSTRDVEAYMVLAMDEHALNHDREANEAFEHGKALAFHRLRELSSGDIESGWTDWILAHALMREAQQALEKPPQQTASRQVPP